MPNKKYALAAGQEPRLELSWTGMWKNMVVRLDGRELGTIPDGAALKAGRAFPLGDGTTVRVQLVQSFGNTELRIERDGVALPGTASDPVERVNLAAGMIAFVAGLNAVLGLVAELGGVQFLLDLGVGWLSLAQALFYAGLGWLVWKKQSRVALGLAIGLFALDGLLTVGLAATSGGRVPAGGIVARIFLILPMARGFEGIKALRERKQAA